MLKMTTTTTPSESYTDQLRRARAVSVPLLAIATPDANATMFNVVETITILEEKAPPAISFDMVRGLCSLNNEGEMELLKLLEGRKPESVTAPPTALDLMRRSSRLTVFFVHNVHRLWKLPDPQGLLVVQGFYNLRDDFKGEKRTCIGLAPTITSLPVELANDVLVLREPRPDVATLRAQIAETIESSGLDALDDPKTARAAEALRGLPMFAADQGIALSLRRTGLEIDSLWNRKRQQVETTEGLTFKRPTVRFDDVGGVEEVKAFFRELRDGPECPDLVLFMDEVEKGFAGSSGQAQDNTGAAQGMLGRMLSWTQTVDVMGSLFLGPPGVAKSYVAEAIACELDALFIGMDVQRMKSSGLGDTEARFDAALSLAESISNGRVLLIGTCNSITTLPIELRRRFDSLGVFFFDLPSAAERAAIWNIWRRAYQLEDQPLKIDDDGWTGAEIRKACRLAYLTRKPLQVAAERVVPVSKSAREQISELRASSHERYLSANKPGLYTYSESTGNTLQRARRELSVKGGK